MGFFFAVVIKNVRQLRACTRLFRVPRMGNGPVSMPLALQSDSKRLARCVRRAFRAGGATLDNPTWAVLDLIEPAVWKINKSDALDARSEFCWIDDDPSPQDRERLRIHGCEDRVIEISADIDPDALTQLIRTRDQSAEEKTFPK